MEVEDRCQLLRKVQWLEGAIVPHVPYKWGRGSTTALWVSAKCELSKSSCITPL